MDPRGQGNQGESQAQDQRPPANADRLCEARAKQPGSGQGVSRSFAPAESRSVSLGKACEREWLQTFMGRILGIVLRRLLPRSAWRWLPERFVLATNARQRPNFAYRLAEPASGLRSRSIWVSGILTSSESVV